MKTEKVPFSHPWEEGVIGDVADVEVGGTPSTSVEAYWKNGIVPWMSSGDVHLRRIHEVPGHITELGLSRSNAKLIDPPNVAIGLAGQGKTRGTVALVLTPTSTNQSIALIKGHEGELDTTFLFHALDARYEELRARSAGGGRAGLSKNILQLVPIALPDPSEQALIAAILDTVDDAVRYTEQVIAKLTQVRAGLLHDLLTYGIDENGDLRDPVRHPEQFEDALPVGWCLCPLGEVVPTAEYGISSSLGDDSGGIPVLRMNNIAAGEMRLDDLKYAPYSAVQNLILKPLDVLFNRTNSIDHVGRTGIWRGQLETASFASYLVRLVPQTDLLDPEFLNYWLNWERTQIRIRQFATPGVHQVNINPTNLRKTSIALPPKPEQVEITSVLTSFDSRLQDEGRTMHKFNLLKQGLRDDLLTGRVRVVDLLSQKE